MSAGDIGNFANKRVKKFVEKISTEAQCSKPLNRNGETDRQGTHCVQYVIYGRQPQNEGCEMSL